MFLESVLVLADFSMPLLFHLNIRIIKLFGDVDLVSGANFRTLSPRNVYIQRG